MILLRKKEDPSRTKDYRPISLMHSFSKLFAKCLAKRLAPRLKEIVAPNQSAFIKDRPSMITSWRYSWRVAPQQEIPISTAESGHCKKAYLILLLGLSCYKSCSTSTSHVAGTTGSPSFFQQQARRFSRMVGREEELPMPVA